MATRTGVPGTTAGGNIWTSANVNNLPGGLIAYAKRSSNLTGITTITDIITITFTAPGSRLYKITGHVGLFTKNTSSGLTKVFIRDTSGSNLTAIYNHSMASGERDSADGCYFDAPSSGSTEYRVSIQTSGADDIDVSAGAAGDPGPSFILIEDVGPSF